MNNNERLSQKRVLLVDDEGPFLQSLKDGMLSATDVDVLVSQDATEAMELVRQKQVDLVVTDLKMPNLDGFDLLAQLRRSHPLLPVMVMTAYATADISARIRSLGCSSILEKPLDLDVFVERVLAALQQDHRNTSFVRGLSVTSLLQFFEIEHKTCFVQVHSSQPAGDFGEIQFVSGVVTYGRSPHALGDAAVTEILSWNEPSMETVNGVKNSTVNVESPLRFLILEGLRKQDEKKSESSVKNLIQPLKEVFGEALLEAELCGEGGSQGRLATLGAKLMEVFEAHKGPAELPALTGYCLVEFNERQKLLLIPVKTGHVVLRIDAKKISTGIMLGAVALVKNRQS